MLLPSMLLQDPHVSLVTEAATGACSTYGLLVSADVELACSYWRCSVGLHFGLHCTPGVGLYLCYKCLAILDVMSHGVQV